MDWFTRFQVEAGSHAVDVEPVIRHCIEDQLLWLWEDDDGQPVSMAGRNSTAAGVARIGPVYTPPEHRRRGYGAAITGACTSDALSRGAHDVVLFTDLANPTSNAIYQEIGYRPLRDHLVITVRERFFVEGLQSCASLRCRCGGGWVRSPPRCRWWPVCLVCWPLPRRRSPKDLRLKRPGNRDPRRGGLPERHPLRGGRHQPLGCRRRRAHHRR